MIGHWTTASYWTRQPVQLFLKRQSTRQNQGS
jgi:hypothetical protein